MRTKPRDLKRVYVQRMFTEEMENAASNMFLFTNTDHSHISNKHFVWQKLSSSLKSQTSENQSVYDDDSEANKQ
jgi:hypothetical protein